MKSLDDLKEIVESVSRNQKHLASVALTYGSGMTRYIPQKTDDQIGKSCAEISRRSQEMEANVVNLLEAECKKTSKSRDEAREKFHQTLTEFFKFPEFLTFGTSKRMESSAYPEGWFEMNAYLAWTYVKLYVCIDSILESKSPQGAYQKANEKHKIIFGKELEKGLTLNEAMILSTKAGKTAKQQTAHLQAKMEKAEKMIKQKLILNKKKLNKMKNSHRLFFVSLFLFFSISCFSICSKAQNLFAFYFNQ